MDGPRVITKLDQFVNKYLKWIEPYQKHHDDNWRRIRKPGYSRREYNRVAKEIKEKMDAQWDPLPELYALLDELCPVYLTCSKEACEKIRGIVAKCSRLCDPVRSYAHHVAKRINTPEDAGLLRIGLAAISIENCGIDYRDTIMAINSLQASAKAAGIDVTPHFQAVAKLSSTKPARGGCRSVAGMLGGS
jgi:hypothetical protein